MEFIDTAQASICTTLFDIGSTNPFVRQRTDIAEKSNYKQKLNQEILSAIAGASCSIGYFVMHRCPNRFAVDPKFGLTQSNESIS